MGGFGGNGFGVDGFGGNIFANEESVTLICTEVVHTHVTKICSEIVQNFGT